MIEEGDMLGSGNKVEDEESLVPIQEKKECCTIGSFINYMIIINFAGIFVACLIVIGSLGTLQRDLTSAHGGNRSCYMYATFSDKAEGDCGKKFNIVATNPCDGSMVAFSFFALCAVAFIISLFIKGILHHNLNWTLFLEVPSLIFLAAVALAICVMISIGNLTTCNSIKSYYKCVFPNYDINDCKHTFPTSNNHKFSHQTRANLAQNTAWFVLLFIIIALVIYIIRLVVYLELRRKKKQSIQRVLEREEFQEES